LKKTAKRAKPVVERNATTDDEAGEPDF